MKNYFDTKFYSLSALLTTSCCATAMFNTFANFINVSPVVSLLTAAGLAAYSFPFWYSIADLTVADNINDGKYKGNEAIKWTKLGLGYGCYPEDDIPEEYRDSKLELTFNQIKSYYNLAPEKYELHSRYIIYKTDNEVTCIVPEGKEEWLNYYEWLIDKNLQNLNEKEKEEMVQYLKNVQKDLHTYKAETNSYFSKAQSIVDEINNNIELENDIIQSNDDKIVLTI